ncbi:hypothetical protein B0H10DRAFT_1951218 [Mycena sp. CBHHK59/15]|nr:hypothetical protein B0H10DRAFT_1951218 [Mycena sp. CBHHK59/15]
MCMRLNATQDAAAKREQEKLEAGAKVKRPAAERYSYVPKTPKKPTTSKRSQELKSSGNSSATPGLEKYMDPDDEDEDDNAAADVPVKKPCKISAARQKQADLEKPHVRTAPVHKPTHQVKLEERVKLEECPTLSIYKAPTLHRFGNPVHSNQTR